MLLEAGARAHHRIPTSGTQRCWETRPSPWCAPVQRDVPLAISAPRPTPLWCRKTIGGLRILALKSPELGAILDGARTLRKSALPSRVNAESRAPLATRCQFGPASSPVIPQLPVEKGNSPRADLLDARRTDVCREVSLPFSTDCQPWGKQI